MAVYEDFAKQAMGAFAAPPSKPKRRKRKRKRKSIAPKASPAEKGGPRAKRQRM